MHTFKISLFVCCFLMFFSCKEEQNTVFSEVHITSENNTLVDINVPEAKGSKTVSSLINSKIQHTIINALHIGNPDEITASSITESIDSFHTEYSQFKNNFPDSDAPWEAQIDGEVMYQSPNITSIAITAYTNTGGAHGILNISFLNFDSVTGKHITNSKLIKNEHAFKKLAKPYLDSALAEKDITFDTEHFELPSNIAYTENGVILLFNIFQFSPYTTEIIEFEIPFEDAAPYLVFNSAL